MPAAAAVTGPGGVAGGLALFRLRQRGRAVEAALCDLLVPRGDSATARRLAADILRSSGADYLVAVGAEGARLAPAPGQGPTLVRRPLAGEAPRAVGGWDLVLGDVELF